MNNIKISIDKPDYRPAIVFDDVNRIDVNFLSVEGDTKNDKVILHNTSEEKIDPQLETKKL